MAERHDDISNYFSNYSKHFHSVQFDLNQINQCKCLIMGLLPYPNKQYTKTGDITKVF